MVSEKGLWNGLDVVRLAGDGYEAVIATGFGANCISFIHTATNTQLMRTPQSARQLCEGVNVYGLPLLFPPNRIQDGRYSFQGRDYRFPLNEPERGNHLHGTLSSTPFCQTGAGDFEYRATAAAPYLRFSHAFTIKRQYWLDAEGLRHVISVTNDSDCDMPVGIGIHAALSLIAGRSYTLHIAAVRQWLVDDVHLIPTGETLCESQTLSALRSGILDPDDGMLSCLLECKPGMEIRLKSKEGELVCVPDSAFRFVMLWNDGGGRGFVCPEPQSWLTNAPNLPLSPEESGLKALKPGENLRYVIRYFYEPRS